MITKTTDTDIIFTTRPLRANGKPSLSLVFKNILYKVECAVRLKPFIIEVLHFGSCLKNNVPTLKNRRIESHVPKESGFRRGLGQLSIDQKQHI